MTALHPSLAKAWRQRISTMPSVSTCCAANSKQQAGKETVAYVKASAEHGYNHLRNDGANRASGG